MKKLLMRTLLAGIDQSAGASRRLANFATLHAALKDTNKLSSTLSLQLSTPTSLDLNLRLQPIPLIYPYLIENGDALRTKLIAAQIFCPTYWPNIANPGLAVTNFIANLVCIPIDQRYDVADMNHILEEMQHDALRKSSLWQLLVAP